MALTLDPLLPAQREAVTCSVEPLLVLGAAGTGKTRTIEARFGGLVERGCRPERMLFLTPSRARADASRAWLEQGLSHGYDELFVLTAVELAAMVLNAAGPGVDPLEPVLGPAERFAMLLEGIDRLSLERHDFGGSAHALLAGFIRRIDRLKAHLVGAEEYARWAERLAGSDSGGAAAAPDAGLELEFAEVYRVHEQLLAEAGARDAGDLIRDALKVVRARGGAGGSFEHVLVDDAHDFDLASATLARAVAGTRLTVAADPVLWLGGSPLRAPEACVLVLGASLRVPRRVIRAA
ncbi:MAG TPA: UvrD-helicase domain-containing protein, partial [Solirubrobacteraceae bacterium]|nr:UvrD-helicase domain-containing protein [Solirubrobacteraceae bacterium]